MEAIVTARIDADLKRRATSVMESHGLSASQAVRKLFEYTATNGSLPFDSSEKPSKDELKRRVAAFDACHTKHPLKLSDSELRDERLRARYEVDD